MRFLCPSSASGFLLLYSGTLSVRFTVVFFFCLLSGRTLKKYILFKYTWPQVNFLYYIFLIFKLYFNKNKHFFFFRNTKKMVLYQIEYQILLDHARLKYNLDKELVNTF